MNEQDHKPQGISLAAVQDNLNRIGYDIEPAQPGDPPNSAIVARRDLGDRVIQVAIDAGGRFRIEISSVVDEWSRSLIIAGVPAHAVETSHRTLNLTGQISSQEEASRLIAALSNVDEWLSRSSARSQVLNRDAKPQ
jgi:hypothetical protein